MQKGFTFVKPKSLSQALQEISENYDEVTLISGGTDVLIQLRYDNISPKKLVDIMDLEELRFIDDMGDAVYIGGGTTFDQVIKDDIINNNFPSLLEAAQEVGAPQIRNVGTLAGNVQTASPAGDGLLTLYALDATVELISDKGSREVNIRDFITGPKKTTKRSNEIIRCFKIAKQQWDYERFFKVGKRNALAISIVNGVIMVNFNGDKTIKDAKITLGAVGPTPLRIKRAESFLIGKTCNKETIEELKNIICDDISPISDVRGSSEYRKYIAAVNCARHIELAKGGI